MHFADVGEIIKDFNVRNYENVYATISFVGFKGAKKRALQMVSLLFLMDVK